TRLDLIEVKQLPVRSRETGRGPGLAVPAHLECPQAKGLPSMRLGKVAPVVVDDIPILGKFRVCRDKIGEVALRELTVLLPDLRGRAQRDHQGARGIHDLAGSRRESPVVTGL